MFSQIKDRKHIDQNFHSVAKVMPWVGLLVLGESKTLAWEFVMAPHRLRALVTNVIILSSSKFGLFYSNFLILTPTFSKVPIENGSLERQDPTFSQESAG